MPAVHTYQILNHYTSRQDLDPGFDVLDNSSNERPDWYEYWPIRKFLQNEPLDENAFYGFLSPKFKLKTNLSAGDVVDFIGGSDAATDVVLFSPSIHNSAFYLNVFEHGNAEHPGLMRVAQDFFTRLNHSQPLESLVSDSRNTVHSNYFIAKPRFWRAWLAITEQLFAFAETAQDPLGMQLRTPTQYRGRREVQMKIFLMERIATWILVTDKSLAARAHELLRALLDGFKEVNDAFGHATGDLLLVEVAARIQSSIRSHDTLARMGGDESVLLADAVEPADAAMLADKLVTAIRNPFVIEGNELRVTGSIGIAVYSGKEREQDELLKNADAAMYRAKASGRNCYCFFEASMNKDAHDHLQMISDLRLAQSHQELALHYQPKFDAEQGNLIGAEALLRWNHPTRGSLPPDQFIPLAEKSGLIVPLGIWVLNEACRQMSEWHAAGHREWTISVNISAVQFTHLGLVNMVRGALEQHALEPRYLTLEITESTAMRDADAGMVILEQLHAMGVRISIDDFGTGYSSLLYLKRLPVTELKIDRGFVRDLPQDTEDAAIVGAIVALGRTLNLEIVAEGVETNEQREFLTRLGCNVLQGFLLGRPMPADRFLQAAKADTEVRRRPVRPISLMSA